jgi:hypothetical protein
MFVDRQAEDEKRAVYNNRRRMARPKGKVLQRARGESIVNDRKHPTNLAVFW